MDLVASQPEDIPTVLLDAYAPGALEQAASILRRYGCSSWPGSRWP
jgi:hypothetical protein